MFIFRVPFSFHVWRWSFDVFFATFVSPVRSPPPVPLITPPQSHLQLRRRSSPPQFPSDIDLCLGHPQRPLFTPTLHLHPDHKRPKSYLTEANNWIVFFKGHDAIPGVHQPFYHRAVEDFLFHRGRTTKELWQITSKLKWMGTVYARLAKRAVPAAGRPHSTSASRILFGVICQSSLVVRPR